MHGWTLNLSMAVCAGPVDLNPIYKPDTDFRAERGDDSRRWDMIDLSLSLSLSLSVAIRVLMHFNCMRESPGSMVPHRARVYYYA